MRGVRTFAHIAAVGAARVVSYALALAAFLALVADARGAAVALAAVSVAFRLAEPARTADLDRDASD